MALLKTAVANVKHVPSTLAAALLTISAAAQSDQVQAIAGLNPKVANVVTMIGGAASLGYLLFGVGKK